MKTKKRIINLNKNGFRSIARDILVSILHLIIMLIASGNISWKTAWYCFILLIIIQFSNSAYQNYVNPEVLNKRGPLTHENTTKFDFTFIKLYMLLSLSISAIGGLEVERFKLTQVSLGIQLLGSLLYVLSSAFGTWAMGCNIHFEMTVRIQENHHVVSKGPYKFVRHPGYLGGIIGTLAYPLILGSFLGIIPAFALAIVFIIRTKLEDAYLMENLEGYKEFACHTRYRLLPYVW